MRAPNTRVETTTLIALWTPRVSIANLRSFEKIDDDATATTTMGKPRQQQYPIKCFASEQQPHLLAQEATLVATITAI